MTSFSAGAEVDEVYLTNLEDAVRLEPGRELKGVPLGSHVKRSPETHAEGPVELSSDLFAFGIVVSA